MKKNKKKQPKDWVVKIKDHARYSSGRTANVSFSPLRDACVGPIAPISKIKKN